MKLFSRKIATICLSLSLALAILLLYGCEASVSQLNTSAADESENVNSESAFEETTSGESSSFSDTYTDAEQSTLGESTTLGDQTDTEDTSHNDDHTSKVEDTSQGDQTIESAETSDVETDVKEEPYDGPRVLTYENMGQLSSGKNVVFFLVDRFDANYYETMVKNEPAFFDRLDGFTHFSDYTSLYCRTYPAVASILTGKDHDYFVKNKNTAFNNFYGDGGALGVLKKNGYTINLYTEQSYVYNDATVMMDYVDNVSNSEGEEAFAVNADATTDLLLRLVNTTFAKTKSEGQFTFIHLYGCHDTSKTSNENIRNTFNLIYYYIDQMKVLGIYEDATIIITGDHAAALSDSKMIGSANKNDDGTRVTAMFFKKSGDSGTPVSESSAQISQDELWNTIFESEGLAKEKNGISFYDIPEGVDRERRYIFEMYKNSKNNDLKYNRLYEYKIVGNANKSESWVLVKETDIIK